MHPIKYPYSHRVDCGWKGEVDAKAAAVLLAGNPSLPPPPTCALPPSPPPPLLHSFLQRFMNPSLASMTLVSVMPFGSGCGSTFSVSSLRGRGTLGQGGQIERGAGALHFRHGEWEEGYSNRKGVDPAEGALASRSS